MTDREVMIVLDHALMTAKKAIEDRRGLDDRLLMNQPAIRTIIEHAQSTFVNRMKEAS
jgi:hypothetical protein